MDVLSGMMGRMDDQVRLQGEQLKKINGHIEARIGEEYLIAVSIDFNEPLESIDKRIRRLLLVRRLLSMRSSQVTGEGLDEEISMLLGESKGEG